MRKMFETADVRALKILKISMFIVMSGLFFTLFVYINDPTPEMKAVCCQSLFSCAFGADIAVGGFVFMDYNFKKRN